MTTIKSINPSNGSLVGEVAVTSAAELADIVEKAHRARKQWWQTSLQDRAQCFKNAAPVLIENAEKIGRLISAEMGRPEQQAIGEATMVATALATKVDAVVEALTPHCIEDEQTSTTFHYDPLGVCAAITPWNFPVNMVQWMVLPALMAGNPVIVKPSEHTPLCTQLYLQTLQQFFPQDVLQIVQGGKEQGRMLVNSDVQLIAFTGSRRAGQQILSDAAKDFKRIILELGGKDPLLVLADADIAAAASFAAQNSYYNSGQVCVSSERMYVHESVAAEFERLLIEATADVTVVAGDLQQSTMGPMVADFQRQHVLDQLNTAKAQGAEVLYGEDQHPPGYVMPTVLRVKDTMDIMQEETFGPISCVRHYSDIDEVLEVINASDYGLSAVIFGTDIAAATEVAKAIETGMVGINKGCGGAQGSPWVGAKESGYGYHGGVAGDRQFAQVKIISTPK
ncbi:Succinate-semialdehyde dehydrogenase [NADP(+)] [Sinobacterium norvegicum]|uniref:Succinate-semialdehyde dehydrogenase [NADP(+)] n=1 Tax=Sinobacterium norvegicum TaxID=1641715 RepID=A0ABM9ADJ5_9GAMM|nr:aldehyde dehydrogenase family protein [Sinobacterium norvegicum]CAH0991281.1 Succinate-semialdehyde dehydrogenase [NADP(+)] [Sinobacterium norvegicum]